MQFVESQKLTKEEVVELARYGIELETSSEAELEAQAQFQFEQGE